MLNQAWDSPKCGTLCHCTTRTFKKPAVTRGGRGRLTLWNMLSCPITPPLTHMVPPFLTAEGAGERQRSRGGEVWGERQERQRVTEERNLGDFRVVQWLRTHLPVWGDMRAQGTKIPRAVGQWREKKKEERYSKGWRRAYYWGWTGQHRWKKQNEIQCKERCGKMMFRNSLWPHGLYSPWNSPGQNTAVGSLFFSRGIFPTEGSNLGLPHCRRILYQLRHQGSPRTLKWVAYPFSSGSSWPRDRTGVSCIVGGFFTNWAITERELQRRGEREFLA